MVSTDRVGASRKSGSTAVWLHFVLVLVALVAIETVPYLGETGIVGIGGVIANRAYRMLPIAAGISVALVRLERRGFVNVIVLAALTFTAMIVLDLGVEPVHLTPSEIAAWKAGEFRSAALPPDMESTQGLRTAVGYFLHGVPSDIPERASYQPGDARLTVALGVQKFAYLLTPWLFVGLLLGIQAWVADHVTFRRRIDERIGRFLAAWVLVPATGALLLSWQGRLMWRAMFGGAGPGTLLLPILPLGVVACVGWWAAWRLLRWKEMTA